LSFAWQKEISYIRHDMRNLLVFLFLLPVTIPATAQHIVARPMPFFHQLPSNEIWDVGQDEEGYLWICTTDGLARYDGYKLQFFRSDHKQPDLLTDNSIVCTSDNGRYVWIGTHGGLNLFDKRTNRILPFPDPVLRDKDIIGIAVDKNDLTWVAAEGNLYKCTADLRILGEYPIQHSQSSNQQAYINSIYIDRKGTLWVMAYGSGPIKYDPETDRFTSYPQFGPYQTSFILYQDASDNYWIGTWGDGLWQFFPDETDEECYKRQPIINARTGESEPIVYSMMQDDTFGYLWVLSFNQLYALRQTPDGRLEQVDIHDLLNTHMMYTRIFKDRDGNLWLSSYDMAYTIFFDDSPIDNYPMPQIRERLGWDANLLALCPDTDNILWVSQDRYGLCLYDPFKDLFSYNNIHNYSGTIEATLLAPSSDGGMWIKRRDSGSRLMKLSQRDMRIYIDEDIRLGVHVADPGEIRQLQEDSDGNLWILCSNRLLVKPVGSNNRFVALLDDAPRFSCLTYDLSGQVWAISEDWKHYRLGYSDGRTNYNLVAELSAPSASQEQISYVCVDSDDCLWMISSLGRIYKSDPGKQYIENMALEKEIEDCSVLGLLADQSSVWIVTNKRIIRYDVLQKAVFNYETSDDNIVVNVFRSRAAGKDGNGGLYVGGHGGFIHIGVEEPSAVDREPSLPRVSDVTVDGRSVFFPPPSGNDIRVNATDRIRLKADARNIQFNFSTLTYSLYPGVRVAYMLEGEDTEWVYPDGHSNSAFYNRLGKGTHRFWLRSESGPGNWSDGRVALVVEKAPAFYETWYAWLFYVLFAGFCIYCILRSYLRRVERKRDILFNEELNRVKLDYFTSVSHELLTPLTIISTTVDQTSAKSAGDTKQNLILKSNVEKLKRMILQILDFRRMDLGRMTLNISYGNIGEFITNICQANFSPLVQKKEIDLELHIEPENIYGYVDFDILDKILYNLLSNAIKYTPERKRIGVSVGMEGAGGRSTLVLKVNDEGIGIAPEEIDHIFTRFYTNRKNRGVESNGIGLSLTKDLVALHHGTIRVESALGKGSCFTLELPLYREAYAAVEQLDKMVTCDPEEYEIDENGETDTAISGGKDDERFAILLVDDNTDLLYTMKGIFRDKYRVLIAANGRQAWDKLNTNTVDVVICDVMMPDMNGWELCRRIKTDLRFNHIPVIILTARKGSDDQISSYEAGADGYIAKPFEAKVLFARVGNLLRSYKMRQAAFRREENIDLDGLNYPRADRQFLESIIGSIEQHLEKSDFNLEWFASDLNMSKSTLHRKIKAMTGLTPLDFIRNIKMKRACMMLLDHRMNISEVAYAVGFNNPKYFTKCFKDEFGITPSEYQLREQ
jgi:signal transduction histidine kinase/DNA-binding response OmpR family regulator/ligand-binding sensor domain-containing protein